jgi:hypothetical protein
VTVGGSLTITVTPSVKSIVTLGVDEYSFPAGASIALDGVIATGSGAGPSQMAGNLTPLTTGLIYGVANGNENNIGKLSAGSGFTQRYRLAATSGLMPVLCEDIVANSTSPNAVTSTSSASNIWAIVGVAYKATLMALPMPPSFDRSNSRRKMWADL